MANSSQATNQSDPYLDRQAYLAFVGSLGGLSIMIVATNTFVCVIIYLNKAVRTCTNGFVVSLALSDIIMGAFFFPLHIAIPTFEGIGYLTTISLLVGVSNVVCLTYDRYLSISSPLTYTTDIQHRFKKMIILCWLVPSVFSFIPLTWGSQYDHVAHKIYIYVLSIFGVVIPFVFIFFVYFYIFKQVKRCTKRLQTEMTDQRTVTRKRTHLFVELKVARVFISISGIFLGCWTPLLYIIIVNNVGRGYLAPGFVHMIAFYMLAIESLVNPFIYCFLKPDIQSALRKTLSKTWRRDMSIRFNTRSGDINGGVVGTSNTNLRLSHNGSSGHVNML